MSQPPHSRRVLSRQAVLAMAVSMIVAVLFAAGCSTSTTAETTADEAPGPTPTERPVAPNEPGDPNGSGDPDVRVVPPLVPPNGAPGTDEAADALLQDLGRFITDEQNAAGVPWPDLRNPDPVAVYMSCADFQNWMTENNTTPSLVEAYTAPASPERGWDLEMFDFLSGEQLLALPSQPPYSMRVEDLVHPAATGITDALLEQVPEGSVAVVYWDSVGRSQNIGPDGEIYSSDDGWTDLGPWVSIMAPTDVGWQVWWDELTEPPPPGSRQDGPILPEDARRDL